ncbi:MAG TPA: sulfatase-like hydrolase/transferase [bacterium]|nr:sulfatase-like hydrolase/transferase [bacterium]
MNDFPLNRRSFLSLSTAALAAAAGPLAALDKPDPGRPNLVMILADDLGYGDLSCYGCPDIQTPNLDRLATGGVRLTDYYASAPVCTPTRCALMTGCYQQRQQNLEWAIHPGIKTVGLPPEEITIASMLKEAGYATGMFGKWHLGARPEWGPNRHGFEEFFGFLSGNIDYFRHIENTGEPDLFENTEPVQRDGYITDLITARSVDFIHRHAGHSFFLYTAYNAPHWPIQSPDDRGLVLEGRAWSQHGGRADYARMVERMDEGIGNILQALEEKGLVDNTLVIFASDNGGDRLGRNLPLRGQKGTLWDGGIRVPCIARWPNLLPAGTVSPQAAITMDLSATLLSAARVKPTRRMDGMSLLAFLSGWKPPVEQTFVWRDNWHDQKALRWGHWKWLKIKGEEYLFNLEEDPGEQENRTERNIDIVYWLREIYRQWESAMPHSQTVFGDDLRNPGAEKQ